MFWWSFRLLDPSRGPILCFQVHVWQGCAMIPIQWYLLGVEPLLELQFRLRVIKGLLIRQVWIACFSSLCVCGLKQMLFAPLKQATILFVTWWGKSTCKKMDTLPKTNSSHLKMDGWNTILSFWEFAYFQRWTVSFRECNLLFCDGNLERWFTPPNIIDSLNPTGKSTCKRRDTLPETNSSNLKMDGWKRILSFSE